HAAGAIGAREDANREGRKELGANPECGCSLLNPLAAGQLWFVPEGGELLHQPFTLVALDDEGPFFAGAARATGLFQYLEQGVEIGFGAGQAGDRGGGLTAASALVPLHAHDAIVGCSSRCS